MPTVTETLTPTEAANRLDQLNRQLSDLATSMAWAKQANNQPALEAFRGQFRELARAAAQLRAQINASDQPPQILLTLATFGDNLIATAKKVGADASAFAQGAGKFIGQLPLVLGAVAALAVVLVLVFYLPHRPRES